MPAQQKRPPGVEEPPKVTSTEACPSDQSESHSTISSGAEPKISRTGLNRLNMECLLVNACW